MTEFFNAIEQMTGLFANLFNRPDWRNMLDVVIVALIVYQLIRALAQTRANSVLKGIGMVLLATWLSDLLQLNALNWLLLQIINTGAVVLVVLFQPELRRGLEQLGRSRWRTLFPNIDKEKVTVQTAIREIVAAFTNLSRRRVGALVVIERNTGLNDIIKSGTRLDAEISAPLLENIFEPNTPLHDGAVILRAERIVAAACILQLSDDITISRELGTRHRAAIGISETTDAVALIVSEETGIISMAREGKLTRYLDAKSLAAILTELYAQPGPSIWRGMGWRKEAPRGN